MDKELIFAKGQEYERIRREIYLHNFLGWSCIIMAITYFIFAVWDLRTKIYTSLALLLFGACSVYLAISEKSKLKYFRRI